jgi:hypothetical protein
VLSSLSEARETLGGETARVHHAARRGGVAARGARVRSEGAFRASLRLAPRCKKRIFVIAITSPAYDGITLLAVERTLSHVRQIPNLAPLTRGFLCAIGFLRPIASRAARLKPGGCFHSTDRHSNCCFGPKIIDAWSSVVRSKNLAKLLDCAFSLVDLPKEVSMADFQQRLRYYLVCPLGLFG